MSREEIFTGAHQVATYVNTALLGVIIFFLQAQYRHDIETDEKVDRHETAIQVNANSISNLKENLTVHMGQDDEKFSEMKSAKP